MAITSYQLLKDINEAIERMEDKMDTRMFQMERRVSVLEEYKNKVMGVVLLLSVFINLAASYVWEKLTRNS